MCLASRACVLRHAAVLPIAKVLALVLKAVRVAALAAVVVVVMAHAMVRVAAGEPAVTAKKVQRVILPIAQASKHVRGVAPLKRGKM
jgi:hypothetical protein